MSVAVGQGRVECTELSIDQHVSTSASAKCVTRRVIYCMWTHEERHDGEDHVNDPRYRQKLLEKRESHISPTEMKRLGNIWTGRVHVGASHSQSNFCGW